MKKLLPILYFILIPFLSKGQCAGNMVWTIFDTSNSKLASDYITKISVSKNNTKWIGTLSGLSYFHNNIWGRLIPDSNVEMNVSALHIENDSSIWIGTFTSGLIHLNGSKWSYYNQANSEIPAGIIRSITIDDAGNKWVGTSEGGVARLNESGWTIFTHFNSDLPSDNVYCIFASVNQQIWIGTNEGACLFEQGNWTIWIPGNSGLAGPEIYIVDTNRNGELLFGTNAGLSIYDGNQWRSYTITNSGLPDNEVYSVAVDSLNQLWIGTSGGVSKFDNVNWYTWDIGNSMLPDNKVNAIAVDKENVKWAGTEGSGVAQITGDQAVKINTLPKNAPHISVSPNPAKDKVTILMDGYNSNAQVEIIGLLGNVVKRVPVTDKNTTIPIGDLTPGIYVVKATTPYGVSSRKLIKE